MSIEYNDQELPEDILDILGEEEFESPKALKPKPKDTENFPQPIYRLKTLHSNETFHAYYVSLENNEHFMTLCELEAALAGPRQANNGTSPSEEAWNCKHGSASAVTEALKAEAIQEEALQAEAIQEKSIQEMSIQEEGIQAEVIQADAIHAKSELIPNRALVIAPTKYGKDLVMVLGVVHDLSMVNADELVAIERPATVDDYRRYLENLEHEEEAFSKCRECIEAHNLPMKLISAHCLLEDSKILFFFTAESRVDFRDLVKDLVGIFHARIELRQIGVRDEARVTGGAGVCGRILCCHGLSDKLNPVSIKMAKDQNLSLNSIKISGPCGRLLCCLSYEHQFYRDARRELPNEGVRFTYDGILFKVIEVNALLNKIRISGEDGRILDMDAARLKYLDSHWTVIEEDN